MTVNISVSKENVIYGINLLLRHFELSKQNLFPRMMSTALTEGAQFGVYSKEQIISSCERAGYIDCRLNGYPIYADYDVEKGIIAPTFLFADIDKKEEDIERIANCTIQNIQNDY